MSQPPNEQQPAQGEGQARPAEPAPGEPEALQPPTPQAPRYAPPPVFAPPAYDPSPSAPPAAQQPPVAQASAGAAPPAQPHLYAPQSYATAPPPGYAPAPPQAYAPPAPATIPQTPGLPPVYAPPPQYQGGYAAAPPPVYPGYPAPGYPVYPQPAGPAGAAGVFDGAVHPGELNRPLYGANIGQAFVRFFKNYADFKGRASRSEYWWMVLVYTAVWMLFVVIAGVSDGLRFSIGYSIRDGVEILLGLMVLVLMLGSIVPWLAITWRRLHDANLAGSLWFISLFPYLGSLAVTILTILPPKPEGRRFDPFTR